jgi:nicotinamidase-related amidase
MLIKAENSCLLIIDVQEKLIPAVHQSQQIIDNCVWLLRLATKLHIPILASEQYPRGLGKTVSPIQALIPTDSLIEKVHFSCMADNDCRQRLESIPCQQIIIAGIEAHVCVLQTAIELVDIGKEVFLVADAVSSRNIQDKELGIERMRDVGAHIVSKEMVLFEWIHEAGTPTFKEVSKEFLQ